MTRAVQQRLLTEEQIRQFRQEALQPRVFQNSTTQTVDHGDGAPSLSLDQADHPQPGIRPKVERIDVLGIHPAQHHVDPFERAQ